MPSFAESTTPKSLGTFGIWQAYSYKDHDQPVCYMVQTLTFVRKKKDKHPRGAARLIVTQRPAENSYDVVSYTSGYNFKAASDVKLSIGKNNFNLFTTQDSAWSRDAKTDRAIATAMRGGSSMAITGIPSQKGGAITDIFALKDAGTAYRAIAKACGMAVEPPPKAVSKNKKKPK